MRPDLSSRGRTIVVGWIECVSLPDWGVERVPAKLDTGARTSALHVEHAVELPGGRVAFDVVLDRRGRRRVRIETAVVRRARVRSSNGHYATRLFVATTLKLGPVERPVEFSLVDRREMLHRMLLGRGALAGLLVDASRRHLHGAQVRRRPRR